MTAIEEELRPHTLSTDESDAARTAFNWALRCEWVRMRDALRALPPEAMRDVALDADVFAATVRRAVADGGVPELPSWVDGWGIEGREK